MDLTILEGNRHKHGPTQEILSSTRTPGAWHRASAGVSKSFISYTRHKDEGKQHHWIIDAQNGLGCREP